MHQSTPTVRILLASLTLAACAGGVASGQTESQGGVRAPLAPPIPSVQGVKSKVAPPTGISRSGTLLNRTGTLLPPAPTVSRPRGLTPRPGPTFPTARPDRDGRPIHIGNGYVARPPLITDRTGLVIEGSAADDHFNLRFHLGSGYTYSPYWRPWHYDRSHGDHAGYSPGHHSSHSSLWYPWRSYSYGSYYRTAYPAPLVYGVTDPYVLTGVNPAAMYASMYNAQAAQAAASAQPAREPTPLEQADAMLAYGESRAAVEAYRKYLDDAPDDAAAMRSLAVGLLDLRRFDEAVAVMVMAYERQPRLARTPLGPEALGGSAELRRRVTSSVAYANRVNSASAWLLVAALMQAEGRDDVALRMVERARVSGLAEPVAAEFGAVLKKS